MRIVQTIAGLQQAHGGTSRSVPTLCEHLTQLGHEVHLVAGRPSDKSILSNPPSEPVQIHWVEESPLTGRWLTGKAFQRELDSIVGKGSDTATIHDHGLWLPSNHSICATPKQSNFFVWYHREACCQLGQ